MKLVLMRHGESYANFENYWTGWKDIPLTPKGKEQAFLAGKKLEKENIPFAFCGTSLLTRSIQSANLVLEACEELFIPVQHSWRLNERHYGALVGVNKDEMVAKYGREQVQLWRRGFKTPLPKGTHEDLDRRYSHLDETQLPYSESLADCQKRVLPFYFSEVVPILKAEKNVLLIAHGNSLRGLIKYLEKLPDDQVEKIILPNATPVIYELGEDLEILSKKVL